MVDLDELPDTRDLVGKPGWGRIPRDGGGDIDSAEYSLDVPDVPVGTRLPDYQNVNL